MVSGLLLHPANDLLPRLAGEQVHSAKVRFNDGETARVVGQLGQALYVLVVVGRQYLSRSWRSTKDKRESLLDAMRRSRVQL